METFKVGDKVKNVRTGKTFEIVCNEQLEWFLENSYKHSPNNYVRFED